MEHRVDALFRGNAGRFVDRDVFRLFGMAQRLEDVLERVGLHVLAHAAASDEFHVRMFVVHAGVEAAFRKEQELGALRLFADVLDHLARAADVVAQEGNAGVAFGMAHHLESRVLAAEEVDEVGIICLVDIAASVVQNEIFLDAALFHLALDVFAHELVRDKADLVRGEAFDNLHDVTAGNAHVAGGLDGGGRIDVADERVVRMLFAEGAHLLTRDGVGEAATGKRSGNHDVFFGVQNLSRFAHETHGGKQDILLRDLGGVFAEFEAVAGVVGNAQDDFGRDVAVREDNRVLVLLALVDFVDQREHLLHFFPGVRAEYGPRMDFVQAIVKFVCCHAVKLDNFTV